MEPSVIEIFNNAKISFIESEDKKNEIGSNESNFRINKDAINERQSPRSIWGLVVSTLRKQGLMTLHTACGEIRDVTFKDNTLNINVKEDYLYNILSKDENYKKIVSILNGINDKLSLVFNLVKENKNMAVENLQRLKDFFGNDLEVK